MVIKLILDNSQLKSVESKTTNDMKTFTFADESIEKESFSLFSPIERKKHCSQDLNLDCQYLKKFMIIVKYLRVLFEKLNKDELVYECEKIFRGELKALDKFIYRAEKNQNNTKYTTVSYTHLTLPTTPYV